MILEESKAHLKYNSMLITLGYLILMVALGQVNLTKDH